jgi:hypothetical protein
MFSKYLIGTLALLSTSVPAQAAMVDAGHQYLIDRLEERGVVVAINPPPLCGPGGRGVSGGYTYSDRYGIPVLGVCQDNATGTDEVAWTENDLDTLRHEAFHYLQDCNDGEVSMSLRPYYDGDGPAPGTDNIEQVITYLGIEPALWIETNYEAMGADRATIRLEFEAFLAARDLDAGTIGATIDKFCPIK